MDNAARDQVRDVIDKLQRPVPDLSTLLSLLCGPLGSLGLLPPKYTRYNTSPLSNGSVNIRKHIPAFQRALLEHIAPTWDSLLAEEDASPLMDQYFCPDNFSFTYSASGDVAVMAYSTITSQPLTKYAIYLLARLASEYPVDRLHSAIYTTNQSNGAVSMLAWEDCIRSVLSVPGKVSNAIAETGEVPTQLEHGTYYNNISVRTESLVFSLSSKSARDAVSPVTYLLSKLVAIGAFPSTQPTSRSQPSFFQATLQIIRDRTVSTGASGYITMWSSLFSEIPSTLTLRSIITSLLAAIPPLTYPTGTDMSQRIAVKRDARLLRCITGRVTPERDEVWETTMGIILGKDWDQGYARIFICWLFGSFSGQMPNEKALEVFIEEVLITWSSPDHIKHSLLSRHRYMTTILLIAISYLPPSSQSITSVSLAPPFISGIGLYVGHLDSSVRRCGMLAAEVVAQRAGKILDFGEWDGEDSGKPWAREVRQLLQMRDGDVDLEDVTPTDNVDSSDVKGGPVLSDTARATFREPPDGYDSDDSLTGYASPSSSRSASPTPSELDAIEKDPALNVGVKKVPRPVYLAQLGDLLRSTGGTKSSNEPDDADKVEMALKYAEELIRKKRGYGAELDENAVNLVYGLIGLQNNYELENFEEKRQDALNALVACAPRKSTPALIEEFFKNQYSTSQRYVALNALALGAREMASLPIPSPKVNPDRISFPSKQLPTPLHQRYLEDGGQQLIPLIMDSISNHVIDKEKDASVDKVPEIVRERRLRISKPKITPVSSAGATLVTPLSMSLQRLTPFIEVATEYFIAPLINQFWLFLRDERTREERTAHHQGRQQYHGAGTGLILNPVVLSHFLRTVAILVHAAQNAPEWMAVVAPDALELAVTIGTRPVSRIETDIEDDEESGGQRGKEASVLSAALELALVVLDGCLEIDGGRTISLEYTTLLLGVGEWAGCLFAQLEKGIKVQGTGGVHEIKLRRAAAGVLLKIDDLISKWRRSMLDIR
ncbi:DNA replication checkpoint protein tel2 [Termitomyces sp. J132]|nr:hypothetical protein H2248_009839 [Termitomyces sp. 'cryptogamus']KNZ75429.1 DNA replication checkpoint protein tel2 [Termitomyces sp. J132]